MNQRFRHVITASAIATMLFGLAAVEAGTAQASVPTPTSSSATVFPQTNPPGPCTSDEIGQSKTGDDGKTYTCKKAKNGSEGGKWKKKKHKKNGDSSTEKQDDQSGQKSKETSPETSP